MLLDMAKDLKSMADSLIAYAAELARLKNGLSHIMPYCQRDYDEKLGFSKWTISQQGCALTCAAMMLSFYGYKDEPPALQEKIKPSGFRGAYINWYAVAANYGMEFSGIVNWPRALTDNDLDSVRDKLREGPVILWVDFRPGGSQQTHFVLGTQWMGDDIRIIDPWDGFSGMMLKRYGDKRQGLRRWLYGMRPFQKASESPVSFSGKAIPEVYDDWSVPPR